MSIERKKDSPCPWTASTMSSDGNLFGVAEDSPVIFLVAFFFLAAVAYGIASYLNHMYYFLRRDRLVVLWFSFVIVNTVVVHIPYVAWSFLFGPIESSNSVLVFVVKDYGRADSRWLKNDPTILTSELFAVTVEFWLSYLVVRGIILGNIYRHVCQLVVCTCQVAKIWFVFGPQLLGGFSESANTFHFLMHTVVGNLFSFAIPALFLYETYLDLSTGVMRYVKPYRWSSPRSSKRSMSTVRNRDSWFWHS